MGVRVPFALVVAALLIAGCGASGSVETDARTTSAPPAVDATAPPDEDPPDPGMRGAPPPAWIATERGAVWLSYATFCWDGGCADAGPPTCGEPWTPDVIVTPGERVSFRVGFDPARAALEFFPPDEKDVAAPDEVRLEPGRTISWVASREGPIWLSTWPRERGDAHYAACLRFGSDPLTVEEALARGSGDAVVRGTLYVRGDDVRLCDGLAESYPPQCPGEHLVLEGAGARTGTLTREGEVAWGEGPTTVHGSLDGARMVVDER